MTEEYFKSQTLDRYELPKRKLTKKEIREIYNEGKQLSRKVTPKNHSPQENKGFESPRAERGIKPEGTSNSKGCGRKYLSHITKYSNKRTKKTYVICGTHLEDYEVTLLCPSCQKEKKLR